MKQRDFDGLYICAHCGKRFPFSARTVYKTNNGHGNVYFCGYTCWRKNGGGRKRVNCVPRGPALPFVNGKN